MPALHRQPRQRTIDSATHPHPRRRRTVHPRGPMEDNPDVRPVFVDGAKAVSVTLSGRLGTGKAFLIDPGDWHTVSAAFGARWLVIETGKVRRRDGTKLSTVVNGTKAASAASPQIGKSRVLILARHLMGAVHPWEHVRHRNGDRLDLRRVNLFVDNREAEWRRARERREGGPTLTLCSTLYAARSADIIAALDAAAEQDAAA